MTDNLLKTTPLDDTTHKLLEEFYKQMLKRYERKVEFRGVHYTVTHPYQEKTTLNNQKFVVFMHLSLDETNVEFHVHRDIQPLIMTPN